MVGGTNHHLRAESLRARAGVHSAAARHDMVTGKRVCELCLECMVLSEHHTKPLYDLRMGHIIIQIDRGFWTISIVFQEYGFLVSICATLSVSGQRYIHSLRDPL